MIAEALKFLASLGAENQAPRVIDLKDPRALTFVAGGSVLSRDIPPAPRAHALGSLEDLIAFADRHATETSRVFFDADQVTLVLDGDGHRLERGVLKLERSSVWHVVVELATKRAGQWFEHKQFLRLLRVDLAGTLPPGVLYDRVKRVAFDNGVTVQASVTKNKTESMGRSIMSHVTGEGEIPEEVTLEAPVYSTPGETEKHAIRCAVEVDPARGMFCLQPLPDEVSRVEALAVASIRERLEVLCKTPAFFGRV